MAPRADRLDLIYQAFCDAFNLETLRRMVWLKLGRTLDNYAAAGTFPQVVFELLEADSRDGFLDDLVVDFRNTITYSEVEKFAHVWHRQR